MCLAHDLSKAIGQIPIGVAVTRPRRAIEYATRTRVDDSA